jgi:hypothetical protein
MAKARVLFLFSFFLGGLPPKGLPHACGLRPPAWGVFAAPKGRRPPQAGQVHRRQTSKPTRENPPMMLPGQWFQICSIDHWQWSC